MSAAADLDAAKRKRTLGALQAARRAKGLDREAYLALLAGVAGRPVESSNELTRQQLGRALDRLNGKASERPMVARIRLLLGDRPEAYALAILARQESAEAPPSLAWATDAQLRRVVQSLEYDARRKAEALSGPQRPAKP